MPSETIKLIPMTEEMKETFLMQGEAFRKLGRITTDQTLRDFSYQIANGWNQLINEMWESGFTLEDIECSMTQ